jgi:hypothetical protein
VYKMESVHTKNIAMVFWHGQENNVGLYHSFDLSMGNKTIVKISINILSNWIVGVSEDWRRGG